MRNRRLSLVGAFAAVVVVVAILVIATRGSSTSQTVVRDAGTTSNVSDGETSASSSSPTTASAPVTDPTPTGPYTTPDMPVNVAVSTTTGLRSGEVVNVTASPENGSPVYGVEARLCSGTASIQFDGQLFPTRAGLCLPKPFAEGTDSFVEVKNEPPYGPVAVKFRVGTGSQTFALQDGTQSTITCDSTNPCQIVLKMQYPNGFGFQGVPVTFR